MALQNAFENIGTESSTDKMVILLQKILSRLPYPNTVGEARIAGTVAVSGGTITVGTLSNQTQLSGYQGQLMVMAGSNAGPGRLRAQIVVTT